MAAFYPVSVQISLNRFNIINIYISCQQKVCAYKAFRDPDSESILWINGYTVLTSKALLPFHPFRAEEIFFFLYRSSEENLSFRFSAEAKFTGADLSRCFAAGFQGLH
ncbi:MAG: hypothetical protein V1799_08775 [bacterium]